MNKRLIAALISLIVVLGTAPVVNAGSSSRKPSRVTIDGHAPFNGDVETFVAHGGGLCASGTTSNVTSANFIPPLTVVFDVKKTLTCDDGSGTFDMRVRAVVHLCDTFDRGHWEITGGTGAYRHLEGEGRLVGTYYPSDSCSAEGVDDHYTGIVKRGDDR
ncbi:MAG: hypothetical protein ABI862_18120 [Ilumatobacteraceae bacterium]